jgi:hypothetical protein
MSKPRKKYKPKGVRMDALTWVISGFEKVAEVPDAGTKLMIKNHASFDEIREGRGNTFHVDNLITMVNCAEALAKRQLGRDWLEEIGQAQDAIYAMAQRGVSGKSFVFTGLELQAVETVLSLHDEQLRQCSVRTLELALEDIEREFKSNKMRKIQPVQELA